MGRVVPLSFGTQSEPGRDDVDAGPLHVNAWVEPREDAKSPYPIFAEDGTTLFATLTNGGAFRGAIVSEGVLYVLSGKVLFSVTISGDVTVLGGIPGQGFAVMDVNQRDPNPEISIVTDGLSYILSGGILSQIVDQDLPSPVSVATLNGFSIYASNAQGKGRNYYSGVDNAGSINALDFFTSEAHPDGIVRAISHKQNYWVLGEKTTEVWGNVASNTQPFRRVLTAPIQKGCASAASVRTIGEDLIWIGDDSQVHLARGYQPQVISTASVARDIEAVSDKSAIVGSAHYSRGHGFYTISHDNWTWRFNIKTGRWYNMRSKGLKRTRRTGEITFGDKLLAFDYILGKIYQVGRVFDEAGEPMLMELRSPPMASFPHEITIDALYLDFQTGVGLNSTESHKSNPLIGMRYSDDGGNSWSNQLTRSLGAQGSGRTRVSYHGLGQTGRIGRIWEIQCDAPVLRTLLGASVEIRPADANG